MPNEHPLTFAHLPTSEGILPNTNKGIRHCSVAFVVPSTYAHFRQTNAFVLRSFGICIHGFKIGTYFRGDNTKLRLYKDAFTWLVWIMHVYHLSFWNSQSALSPPHNLEKSFEILWGRDNVFPLVEDPHILNCSSTGCGENLSGWFFFFFFHFEAHSLLYLLPTESQHFLFWFEENFDKISDKYWVRYGRISTNFGVWFRSDEHPPDPFRFRTRVKYNLVRRIIGCQTF